MLFSWITYLLLVGGVNVEGGNTFFKMVGGQDEAFFRWMEGGSIFKVDTKVREEDFSNWIAWSLMCVFCVFDLFQKPVQSLGKVQKQLRKGSEHHPFLLCRDSLMINRNEFTLIIFSSTYLSIICLYENFIPICFMHLCYILHLVTIKPLSHKNIDC